MKIKCVLILLSLVAINISSAYADIESLSIKFAGGCRLVNTTAGCSIRTTALGTNLEGEGVYIQHADTSRGTFRNVSNRVRFLDTNGQATFRFRNAAGCYRSVQGNNGAISNVLCEK